MGVMGVIHNKGSALHINLYTTILYSIHVGHK